ncbi:MAG: hypothetical protein JWN43_242 [Gammaproteobacteria bacterium]|nr:hypothetical protein [Gammaproteobacteria bacterium]
MNASVNAVPVPVPVPVPAPAPAPESDRSLVSDGLSDIVDVERYPLHVAGSPASGWRIDAQRRFRTAGVCIFDDFLLADTLDVVCAGLGSVVDAAYVSTTYSNVYLQPGDDSFPCGHPRREEHVTRVGTLAEDQLAPDSLLHRIHASPSFRRLVGDIVGAPRLFGYADGLTSVNVLVFSEGGQLGWHFDESDYAVTLLLSPASVGGLFEYAPNIRSPADENYSSVGRVLAGKSARSAVAPLRAGSLMIFRGRRSLHRVTPVGSGRSRLVAVLSFDTRPGIRLSEHDRQLFFGRIK